MPCWVKRDLNITLAFRPIAAQTSKITSIPPADLRASHTHVSIGLSVDPLSLPPSRDTTLTRLSPCRRCLRRPDIPATAFVTTNTTNGSWSSSQSLLSFSAFRSAWSVFSCFSEQTTSTTETAGPMTKMSIWGKNRVCTTHYVACVAGLTHSRCQE